VKAAKSTAEAGCQAAGAAAVTADATCRTTVSISGSG
jgi:hypothetical protein